MPAAPSGVVPDHFPESFVPVYKIVPCRESLLFPECVPGFVPAERDYGDLVYALRPERGHSMIHKPGRDTEPPEIRIDRQMVYVSSAAVVTGKDRSDDRFAGFGNIKILIF